MRAEKRKRIKRDLVTEEIKSELEIGLKNSNLQFSSGQSNRSQN